MAYLGAWDYANNPWYFYYSDGYITQSYTYVYENDDSLVPGTGYGPTAFNGQACTTNWYEPGSVEGIELFVAKNSSYFYDLWWSFSSMSQFDYSQKSVDFFDYKLTPKLSGYSYDQAVTLSSENECYALWTTSAESSCLAGGSGGDDDDDVEDGGHSLLATAAAF
ncbi:hypothetical protein EON64_16165 [archaeon]|nr:MAG: hypothetical protein EON64_16165 [archaeon]